MTRAPGALRRALIAGRFRILGDLGAGGMSAVHLAEDTWRGAARVALKCVPLVDGPGVAALRAERELLARLAHPHVVVVHGFTTCATAGLACLVLEFAPGRSASEAALDRPLEERAAWLVAACRALDYLHSRGVVHGDVKAANLLVDTSTSPAGVVLVDFGLGRAGNDVARPSRAFSGTVSHAAPEVSTGDPPTPASDRHALGVTAWELLVGRVPFAQADPVELLEARRTQDAPSIATFGPHLPRDVVAAVDALLAREGARRGVSALPLALALAQLAPAGTTAETTPSLESWARWPTFQGRGAVERLRAHVTTGLARGGGGRPLLVRGAPGSGRTRLLGEAALVAEVLGVRVVSGRGGGEERPLGALADVVTAVLDHLGPGADAALRDEAPILARLDATLAARLGVAPAPALAPTDERLRLGRATWSALATLLARPLLVLVSEVEAMDEAGAWVVAYLARKAALEAARGQAVPLALIVTCGAGSVASDALATLALEAEVITLGGLDEAELASAIAEALPGLGDAALVAHRVHAAAGGNPDAAEGLLRRLVVVGALSRSADGWRADPAHGGWSSAPRDLASAVSAEIALQPEAVRGLLAAVALTAGGVSVPALAGPAGLAPGAVTEAVARLVRSGLAEVVHGTGAVVLRVASQTVARSATLALAPEARTELALALLRAPRVHGVVSPVVAARLAETAGREADAVRFLEAALDAPGGDPITALAIARHLAGLARGAAGRAARRRVVRLLLELERREEAEAEIALLHALPPPPPEDAADEALLLRDACLARGRLREAIASARTVVVTLPEGGAARWDATLTLGRALSQAGDLEAGAVLAEAEATAGDEGRLGRAGLAAGAHALRGGRLVEATRALSLALPRLERHGARADVAACHNNLGVAALARGEASVAARHFALATRVRERSGERAAMAGTLINLGLLEVGRGRPEAARRHLLRALEVKEEVGDRLGMASCLLNLAVARAEVNEVSDARALAARARVALGGEGPLSTRAALDLLDADLDLLLGRLEDASQAASAVLAMVEEGAVVGATDVAIGARLTKATVHLLRGEGEASAQATWPLTGLRGGSAGRTPSPLQRCEAGILLADALSGRPPWLVEWSRDGRAVDAAAALEAADLALRVAADAGLGRAVGARARLARAKARIAAGDVRSAAADVRAAAELAGRAGPRALRLEIQAALGALALAAGDLVTAERHLRGGLGAVREFSRQLAEEDRAVFLADPRRARFRMALMAVRRGRLEAEEGGAYFAPLAGGSAPQISRRTSGAPRRAPATDASTAPAARLRRVLGVTADVSALLPVEELLPRVLEAAMAVLSASRGFVVLADGPDGDLNFAASRDAHGREVPQAAFAISRTVLAEAVRSGLAVQTSDARTDARFGAGESVLQLDLRSVLVAPLVARRQVLGALYVDNPQATGVFSEADREILELFAAQAAVAVDNARLHRVRLEQERLIQELEVARSIQLSLLPQTLPRPARFRLAATMEPAREVGGDWYDVLELPGDVLRLAIADVAGKGVPAGLFMVMARTLLRDVGRRDLELPQVLSLVNDALEAQVEGDRFMSLLLLELGPLGTVHLCSAGHEPALVLRAATGEVEAQAAGGIVLGAFSGILDRLASVEVRLDPGDILVAFTDGVTECRSPAGELFGRERLVRTIGAARGREAQAVLDAILADVVAFRAGGDRSDDLTALVIEAVAPPGAGRSKAQGDRIRLFSGELP